MEVTPGTDATPTDEPTATEGAEGTDGAAATALATAAAGTVAEPIVVPNTLWAPADPKAYLGGRAPTITHLRRARGRLRQGRQRRAAGALDVIPTNADYVLDLIRAQQPLAAALGARLLRHGDDVGGDAASTTWTASTCSRSGPARGRPTCSSWPAR